MPDAEIDAVRAWVDGHNPLDEPPRELGLADALRRVAPELHPDATHYVRYSDESILDAPDDAWSSGVTQTRFLLLALQADQEPEYLGEHVIESTFYQ